MGVRGLFSGVAGQPRVLVATIIALIVFFAVGGLLLSKVRMREGILAAGNEVPAVI